MDPSLQKLHDEIYTKNQTIEDQTKSLVNLRIEMQKLQEKLDAKDKIITQQKTDYDELKNDNEQMKDYFENSKEEFKDLLESKDQTINDQKLALDRQTLLLGGLAEHLADSPVQKMVNTFPGWSRVLIAPGGAITGSELGMIMGSLVSITSYIVTHSNSKLKVTFLGGLLNLLGLIIATVLNNVVTHISTVQNVAFWSTVGRAATSVPWVVVGGLLPLLVGGFIHQWATRAIVTGVVTLVLKIVFAIVWTFMYNIPMARALGTVLTGVSGIAIAAGVPSLIDWIVKLFQ